MLYGNSMEGRVRRSGKHRLGHSARSPPPDISRGKKRENVVSSGISVSIFEPVRTIDHVYSRTATTRAGLKWSSEIAQSCGSSGQRSECQKVWFGGDGRESGGGSGFSGIGAGAKPYRIKVSVLHLLGAYALRHAKSWPALLRGGPASGHARLKGFSSWWCGSGRRSAPLKDRWQSAR